MARMLPSRLKSYTGRGASSNSSANGSGTSTPKSNMPKREVSPSGLAAKGNGLILKIVVSKGKNLAPKDRSGTSDPFLVISLGDSKDTTQYVPKTLNPEWNYMSEMPVTSPKDLLVDIVCWDKDRFGKDYMGEFDLALEDIFSNGKSVQEPKWYPLKSKRSGSRRKDKDSNVSGEVQLQFKLSDPMAPLATSQQVMEKFWAIAGTEPDSLTSTKTNSDASPSDDEDEEDEDEDEPSDEAEDPTKPETAEKKRRRRRLRGLRKSKAQHLYEFVSTSDVVGIVFLEISSVTDLPPEKNVTRTSFDMDPFVVASLGKKTYRTRVIRHKLNPIFNEKMIFQVLRHEQAYSIAFSIMDRDKLSGNDFICSTSMPLQEITSTAPKADPDTGLYELPELPEFPGSDSTPKPSSKSRFKIALSRSTSSQSLGKQAKHPSSLKLSPQSSSNIDIPQRPAVPGNSAGSPIPSPNAMDQSDSGDDRGDQDFHTFHIPLKLKNFEKWEEKHKPELHIKAKYMPYPALRQQFWRSMLKQYDVDESDSISKVELTTMLDTLGSTLKESTIDNFFKRFPHMLNDEEGVLTYDEAVICLEEELLKKDKRNQTVTEKIRSLLPHNLGLSAASSSLSLSATQADSETTLNENPDSQEQLRIAELGSAGEEGELIHPDDLNDKDEEHVVEIKECPICHQPRLNRRSDSDIITHIATCASQDWRQVNNIVMAGFVTSSQAQRKWYSKVITKISYGGYKLGANSANILVQDRITGQINEERMSIYVRLGIRLLYKGLKSREMENKRIRKLLRGLSIKQGVKYDDPASKNEIPKFVAFHRLDLSEVLYPLEHFKNFNEFFYRELKPTARPVSAPENPRIIVSPADCRSVVFNQMDVATKIWVKGREFSIKRLLGDAYPEDVERYTNGALGIFRLAPQDYHRFHIPVDGVMGTPKTIEGEYYTVNPMAIRSALDVYGENVRIVVPIDSVAHGRVMVICVGAMMVGSTVITRHGGETVRRGEELGYFKFGGSTLLILFEPGTMKFDDDLADNSTGALETLVRVGMSIGHHPQEPQHTQDMLKPAAEISESDRADAKRRIEGSMETNRVVGGAANLIPGMGAA